MITEDQIKHMRDRFLGWKLPEDFRPDGGVRFDKDEAKQWNPNNATYEPYGTNLFDAQQAERMIRYMLDGLPVPTKSQGVNAAGLDAVALALTQIALLCRGSGEKEVAIYQLAEEALGHLGNARTRPV